MADAISIRAFLALAFLALALMAPAGVSAAPAAATECVATEQLPDASEGVAVAKSSVQPRLVDPVNDAAVDADSVVVLDVDYRVADFEPGKFGLMVSFASLVSMMSPYGKEGRYELSQAVGRVRLCVPLRPAYETARIRWPLSLMISLNKSIPSHSPHPGAMFEEISRSEALVLNSVRPSRETESLQKAAVDPGYRDAVMSLASTILQMRATGEVCAALPAIEVEFSAAYRGWAARNAPVIERVLVLQRDMLARDSVGPDVVDALTQSLSTHAKGALQAFTPEELQRHCERYTRAFSNPRSDLETAGAAQLAVIHAQGPATPPSAK